MASEWAGEKRFKIIKRRMQGRVRGHGPAFFVIDLNSEIVAKLAI
jgi:hypothetical protein